MQNDAETASTAALTANSKQMQALLTALQQGGVAAADVQTQQVQLNPRYTNPDKRVARRNWPAIPQSTWCRYGHAI